jgi:phosphate uptake regulator|tara:strand:- start:32713 stop:33714 length:1002 start_codon:yes stop_codon:yes gene_type:complete
VVKIDVRKLISFGKGSYIVSMPKSWIEKNNLKKGDLISVSDDGFELILKANQEEKKSDPKEIDIDSKGKDMEVLKAEIVSSYLNNYDTINIQFDNNNNEAPKIKEILRNLSGLEIMEQTSSRISAKNLININEISIGNIIRRMDIITRAMIEDAILCLTGQCSDDSIHHRDIDVNRLYFLGSRVIKNAMINPRVAKSLGKDPWQLHSETLMILRLERIADSQKRISRYLSKLSLDKTSINDLNKIYISMSEAYNDVMKSYYNQDKGLALNIEVTNKDRTISCDKFLEKFTLTHSNSKSKSIHSSHVIIAKIIENLKSTSVEIRNIARTVLCCE